tara:strand:+ start:1754 stop:1996 length:243 start_codon:yes stop_codon:yes gene_type:complete
MQVLNIVLAIAILYVILYYKSEGFASYAYAGSFDDDGVLGARRYSDRIGDPFLRESPETNPEIDAASVINVAGIKWPNTL